MTRRSGRVVKRFAEILVTEIEGGVWDLQHFRGIALV